ncbi:MULTISPECIES: efflux RND transporter periplasmic adaptor subunit [Bradyrhizobium]|uniref:Efflux transporter periplasmic adaptor subunit n=1 Tax=Bradyrhizobium arachidis TaxID=858423 RepID=A0AAE7NLA9_9BRAD|nr:MULTISPECIES: HlyD family efflux transporter periplasmic adaptor subunit [Bradyrhizobium]QOG22951.1 HlyD family efflux transporter periplasmic adaptor subunit [Bradyrhizobium sp. SEMIA]QOZ65448.1 efflux transporter periplasmic adaptor subunit [Bradyrhizobium arachidis]UFW49976.1 HlyD family efflux transporter periplasmic adaptor subunit [Bradyrhizobium arachidis]SFV18905.1 RND family efflux transporter, MFP subunit [Bradyrhizobium arachidis]
MRPLPARFFSRHLVALTGLLLLSAPAARAAEDEAPKGPAVTVLKAAKSCFSDIVEATGTIIAREETSVRPERPGLKVTEVLAEAGDTITAGQVLARLALPEGGTLQVAAPVAGVIATSTAQIGNLASAKGEALFTIVARSEYDLVGLVATTDIRKLAVGQQATVRIAGAGDLDGKVRRIGPTVEPNIQQGMVYIGISSQKRLLLNASGRALIKTGQSCNVAVPLTAVQYSSAGTVVQVIRRNRVETKRVEIGLMSGGNIEVRDGLNEGDIVVARAGALLREGDPVRPVMAAEAAK